MEKMKTEIALAICNILEDLERAISAQANSHSDREALSGISKAIDELRETL